MRILHLVTYFYPALAYGGPPRVVYDLSKKLTERGHDVTVYTTDLRDRNSRLDVKKNHAVDLSGLKVFYFKVLSTQLVSKFGFFFSPELIRRLRRDIRNFDILHIHDYRIYHDLFAAYYARKNNVPYVLSAYGSAPRDVKPRQKFFYDRFLGGYSVLRGASRLIALTDFEAEAYERLGVERNRISVIPLGIDFNEFRILPEKGVFRKKYGLSDDERIILFLGRIHRNKGLGLLVRAFANLAGKHSNMRLVVVGCDDGFLQELKYLIKSLGIADKVLFTGPLYGRDRINAYVDADVFALTSSHQEETSLAVLEAMASGTPVVVTKQASVPGLEEYNAGYNIEYNQQILEDKLLGILSLDSGGITSRRSNARRLVMDKFSYDKIIDSIENVYSALSGK